MPVPSSHYKNKHFASFATTSRLIACLTSESLVPAFFIPSKSNGKVIGLCVLFYPHSVSSENGIPSSVIQEDILAVVALKGQPVLDLKQSALWNGIVCPRVDMVDSYDMFPHILSTSDMVHKTAYVSNDSETIIKSTQNILRTVTNQGQYIQVTDGYDAVSLWEAFSKDLKVNDKLRDQIGQELQSSIDFQEYTYDHPKSLPHLNSNTVAWEQSIVEGHATHPMHKARKSYPPMPPLHPGSYDMDHPQIRLVAIPKDCIDVRGTYEELTEKLINHILSLDGDCSELRQKFIDYVFVPIHELQLPNIEAKFHDAIILPSIYSIPVEALASLRSVAIPDILPGYSIKLCLGIKISSALRTVTPFTTYFGPGFSYNVVPKLTYDRNVLTVERELGTVSYSGEHWDISKHCSSVIREAIEYDPAYSDDLFVPCAALVEKIQKPDTDETLVTHVWGLDSRSKRVEFLDRYVDLSLQAFLPPCLENGVAFEAHGQNTLARFSRKTGQLKGFVIRDFGGIKVHRETLKRTIGCDIDVLPDSCVEAFEIDEVCKLLYHTLFHCQFQRLIRVLDLHYDGSGWDIVRGHMKRLIPKDHVMWPMFMEAEKVPGKCLVRMKIDELYRDVSRSQFSNAIQDY
ncbi:IucC family-domain-containing protein [Pilobolus umbonatus]|nr:IucC family-domain-containing protein [Pilobolus umbonatus]